MSKTGIIFDIKQLAVFDGPGIRTTVFMKGCPLRCKWCHNPEGLSFLPQLMVSTQGCDGCGRCKEVCPSPEHCTACGRCVVACPRHLRKICGTEYTAEALAKKLWKDERIFRMNGGGVTLSGGEPTAQWEFVLELLERLEGIHRAIETCGYCSWEIFAEILNRLDYIIMDIKLADPKKHKYWTGKSNERILANLEQLKCSKKPFTARIPLIPGVNDTKENLRMTAELLKYTDNLERLELLPYHKTAGAKYSMVNLEYAPRFDENQEVNAAVEIFERYEIPVRIL
ncbi:glycyl-radical enzyme activating protein [bacterium 1XD21-13]|nr:glycyl-radical enzyme activating protein [bacterium 1XD21-13]